MDCPLRLRLLPLTALSLAIGCAGGEPSNGFTSLSSFGPGTGQMDTGDDAESTGASTSNPNTGDVMTSNATGDTGPDPDGPSTGPDPDTGPADAGCVPEAEICDGIDNDCDLEPDNGNPGADEDCNTGMAGPCAAGTTACEGGAIACNPAVAPQAESCNGVDDDCNGQVDDGNPGSGGACNTGMSGVCSPGTNQCSGGGLVCMGNVGPSAETCDNEDDDCDGVVDDGNPGGGGGCNTGLPGICSAGIFSCSGGGLVCQQNQGAVAEVCGNGLDDDCNGVVDNGCGCPFGLCTAMVTPQTNGCDPCVSAVCAADAYCCGTAWDGICVGEVETVCGQADCISPSCAHLVCTTGVALVNGCHPCVGQICAADAFCCSNSWDGICVGEVGSVCGLAC